MDVLITPEAWREIEALRILRPRSSAWGFLVGHKRGARFFVEKVFPAAGTAAAPSERLIAEVNAVWPGRVIGLFAVRPAPEFRKALPGPALYGKLFLRLGPIPGKSPLRPFVVGFDQKFSLQPVALAEAGKAKIHE